ncbi:MAG: hypothetical protein ACKO34_05885 [Vampirovibrionales bacterium]
MRQQVLSLLVLTTMTIQSLVPTLVFADGLIPLRPISSTTTTAKASPTTASTGNSLSSVSGWQPLPKLNNSTGSTSTAVAPISNILPALSSTPTYTGGVSVLAGGQVFSVCLNEPVSSQFMRVGESITGTLDAPITNNGIILVPAGSEVAGTVMDVVPARRVGQHGEIDLRFLSITKPNGERIAIDGVVLTKSGDSIMRGNTYKGDVLQGTGIALGSTAAGALTGTAVGGLLGVAGTGAGVGTAIGAAAGVGYALYRRGKGVELPKGSYVQVRLQTPGDTANASPRY